MSTQLPNELVAPSLFTLDGQDPRASRPAYRRRRASELGLREHWFRDAIAANPDLVIEPCRLADLTNEDWYLWKTEAPLTLSDDRTGSIDVLLVSSGGRVGLVETKLSYNREGRREVLAQLLDYAIHLPGIPLARLPQLPRPDATSGTVISSDDVAMHLAQGDFLLVIAGDMLDRGAVRLGQALLGSHLINAWDLALVDLTPFESENPESGPRCIIVPSLRGTLFAEPRQVVRIELAPGSPRPVIHIENHTPSPTGSVRQRWDEARFRANLATAPLAPPLKELALFLLALADGQEIVAAYGTGQMGSLTLKRSNKGLIEFYLNGSIGFRTEGFEAALGPAVGQRYRAAIEELFGRRKMWGPAISPDDAARHAPELMKLISNSLMEARQSSGSPAT